MRIRSLVPLMIAGLAAGCGQVQSGLCEGEQSDNVECTVDVCEPEARAWAHIPDHSLCGDGMRCDPTAGCVAAGALSGTATLLGKTDHSGITVSVEGIEGSATTDANGAWQLANLPPGTYTVTYSKEKYFSQSSDGLIVLAETAALAPTVTLQHGEQLVPDRTITSMNNVLFTPSKSHMVSIVNTAFGPVVWAHPLDGSTPPVALANTNSVSVTNTHVVWSSNGAVWSRPLTGATPAIRLGSVEAGGSINVVGTPRTYTVIRKSRFNGTFTQASLWVARTDGSAAPFTTPAWLQPDSLHGLTSVFNNETHAVFGITNNTSYPPSDALANTPVYRIELATNTLTALNLAFATNYANLFSPSPDGNHVYGLAENYGGSGWYRAFFVSITGAAANTPPKLAPDYGAPASYKYGDYPCTSMFWMPDSSGVVFGTCSYPGAGGGTLEGGLKVWLTSQAAPTLLAPYQAWGNITVLGSVAVYTDPANRNLKAVTLSTSPATHNLDISNNYITGMWSKLGSTAYVAWGRGTSTSSSPTGSLHAVDMTLPLTAAPTVVQLGGAIPGACQFEAQLSGTTLYQLCGDTGTLTAYTQGSATPAGQITGVVPGMLPLQQADRLAFVKTDALIYSAANTGTFGADVKPLTSRVDLSLNSMINLSNWVIYRDPASQVTRVSTADGSAIDEPLFECDAMSSSGQYLPTLDNTGTHLWAPNVRCATETQQMHVPVANLP